MLLRRRRDLPGQAMTTRSRGKVATRGRQTPFGSDTTDCDLACPHCQRGKGWQPLLANSVGRRSGPPGQQRQGVRHAAGWPARRFHRRKGWRDGQLRRGGFRPGGSRSGRSGGAAAPRASGDERRTREAAGKESSETTHPYGEADLKTKEEALSHAEGGPGAPSRYKGKPSLLELLDNLGPDSAELVRRDGTVSRAIRARAPQNRELRIMERKTFACQRP
jgi:hypothetical protein